MKIQSNEKKIEHLKELVKGQIVLPDDPNYDEVRKIWNAMIDRRPAVIVQCAEADDVRSGAPKWCRCGMLDFRS